MPCSRAAASASGPSARTNPILTPIAKWLLLNSKAGAIIALVLAAVAAVGFGGWGITSHQLKSARETNTALAIRVGASEGQLRQLAHDSQARADDAKAAIERANKTAEKAITSSRNLLSAQPSNPKDLCQSADALIRQEIEESQK